VLSCSSGTRAVVQQRHACCRAAAARVLSCSSGTRAVLQAASRAPYTAPAHGPSRHLRCRGLVSQPSPTLAGPPDVTTGATCSPTLPRHRQARFLAAACTALNLAQTYIPVVRIIVCSLDSDDPRVVDCRTHTPPFSAAHTHCPAVPRAIHAAAGPRRTMPVSNSTPPVVASWRNRRSASSISPQGSPHPTLPPSFMPPTGTEHGQAARLCKPLPDCDAHCEHFMCSPTAQIPCAVQRQRRKRIRNQLPYKRRRLSAWTRPTRHAS